VPDVGGSLRKLTPINYTFNHKKITAAQLCEAGAVKLRKLLINTLPREAEREPSSATQTVEIPKQQKASRRRKRVSNITIKTMILILHFKESRFTSIVVQLFPVNGSVRERSRKHFSGCVVWARVLVSGNSYT